MPDPSTREFLLETLPDAPGRGLVAGREALAAGSARARLDAVATPVEVLMRIQTVLLAGAVALACSGAPARAADFTVTGVGFSAYSINGQNNPVLTLERGRTYAFAVNAPGHPFWIKSVQGTGTANAFNNGVTNNGVSSGTLTFTVPAVAPNTLFYNCQFHGAMTNRIDIRDPSAVTPATWSALKALFRE
jgi:hypothetical protein